MGNSGNSINSKADKNNKKDNDSSNNLRIDSDFETVHHDDPALIQHKAQFDEMTSSGILVQKEDAVAPPAASPPAPARRIVKASPPVKLDISAPTVSTAGTSSSTRTSTSTSTSSKPLKNTEENEDAHAHVSTLPPVQSSPSVYKEIQQESLEQHRQQRIAETVHHSKDKRTKLQQQNRREQPETNKTQANPFSRFLSAFSVESKFPNHKRSYETTPSEVSDEPSEKRFKEEEEDSQPPKSSPSSGGGDSASSWNNLSLFLVAGAVVAVVVALRLRKR
jgi:hypothetical protein